MYVLKTFLVLFLRICSRLKEYTHCSKLYMQVHDPCPGFHLGGWEGIRPHLPECCPPPLARMLPSLSRMLPLLLPLARILPPLVVRQLVLYICIPTLYIAPPQTPNEGLLSQGLPPQSNSRSLVHFITCKRRHELIRFYCVWLNCYTQCHDK